MDDSANLIVLAAIDFASKSSNNVDYSSSA
jgi:hypothetical protein